MQEILISDILEEMCPKIETCLPAHQTPARPGALLESLGYPS